jgi:hypothetical protein
MCDGLSLAAPPRKAIAHAQRALVGCKTARRLRMLNTPRGAAAKFKLRMKRRFNPEVRKQR